MKDNKALYQLILAASQRAKEKDYWLNKLSGEWEKSCFPRDCYNTNAGNRRLEVEVFEFSHKLSSRLIQLSRGSDARLHIVLAAGLNALLYRYMCMNIFTLSDREPEANKKIAANGADIVVGTPILKSGKEANLINTLLVLRTPVNSRMTFKELVLETRQTVSEAIENMNYPLEVLIRQLNLPLSSEEDFPLFDIVLLLENIHDRKYLNHVNLDMIFSFTRCESSIKGRLEYNPLLYRETTIEQIISRYKYLLGEAAANTDITLPDIDIISEKEKKQLLVDFNDTSMEYPRDKTIHELFEEQVSITPDGAAVIGVERRAESVEQSVGARGAVPLPMDRVSITYGELNRKSNQLAHVLRSKGVVPDTIVGIMVERSVEMVIGILGILKAGGAYLPIELDYPEERKKYMLEDSKAALLLTVRDLSDICRGTACRASICDGTACCAPTNLAYVIYTSGTTGKPKGVLTRHYNVNRVVRNTNYIDITGNDRLLQLSNYAFDGSIFDIYGALLNSAVLVMMEREDVSAVERLAEVIKREAITVFFVTTALFNILVDLGIGCLGGIRKVLFGGERISAEHSGKALEYLGKDRIIHVYGPTETTVYATYYFIDSIGPAGTIPIGKPIANTTIYILDRSLKPVPLGVSGEVYIGGAGVARGYLNQPELTAEKFLSVSYKSYRTYKTYISKKIYKTGDLARWLADGNIEFIGRIDHQVKIRGFRIEPGEIESRLLNHIQVKEAVVLVREDSSGDKYLCAYVVAVKKPRQTFNMLELREYLSRDLPDYMVPANIIALYRMPLTPNGKVDRAALPIPEAGAAAQFAYTAPRNRLEQKLAALWTEVLKVKYEHLSIDANFIEMGGHSLKATFLASKIHKAFAVDVPLAEIYARPTIRELAEYIRAAKQDKYLSIEPGELKDYYPLSSAQKRLYILQQLDVDSTAYNMPEFMVLAGNLETAGLECTFKELIARHESLRTSFEMIRDDPAQRIHDEAAFAIDYNDQELPADFIRPFDLFQAPLFRAGLKKEEDKKYVLMVDMHHIISDGTSIGVFIREFMALYEGEDLPPVRIQYKDFSEWQNSEREKEAVKMQEMYWLKEFAGEIPVLNLPLDYTRPVIQDFAGNTITFQIGREQTQQLKVLAVKEDASLYMILLTLYNILLSKLSGREDIVVGCPVAGRIHGDLENVIGMFVNTLALRNYPAGEKGFVGFLREVREKTLAAFENQDYQFEDLVDHLAVNRDASRNPLFDVVLIMQNLDISEIQIPGLKLSPFAYENKISKFDMTWTAAESEKGIFFAVNYCTKLFKMETMNRLTGYFKKIVASILEYPEVTIQDIEIITEEERELVLYLFNDTRTAYPNDKTIHELFEEQAERAPGRMAVIGLGSSGESVEQMQITYRQLNEKSNQLAQFLHIKGIAADDIVALMFDRCIEMIIGMMAVLKAGGAYLPIDPGYPPDRIDYMLKDSNAKVLVSEVSKVSGGTDVIKMSELNEPLPIHPTHITHPTHLCYVIYTSGTTGKPKGVVVPHRALANFIYSMYVYYSNDFGPADNCLSLTNFSFDVSVCEIFMPLVFGSGIVVLPYEKIFDPGELAKAIVKESITFAYLPPGLLKDVFDNLRPYSGRVELNKMLVGVEPIKDYVLEDYMTLHPAMKIVNGYGPTEAAICATAYRYCSGKPEGKRVPIGKPLFNNTVVLLDKYDRLVPVGVPGELCISGDGLAKGYVNNPELTAEKFISTSYKAYISKKIYKTGDLARWLPDGNIEFLGRLDHQVKIRGFRVELGEIENLLLAHKAVKEAVVVDVDLDKKAGAGDGSGDKSLCAFIVVDREFERIADTGEFREHLSRILPDYMIPSFFVPLEKLPLTPNGKLDRKALPIPVKTRSYLKTTYVEPESQWEIILASIWKEVLGVDKVGLNDNFFELGGNSLNIVQLSNKLKKAFEFDIPTVTLFRFPKISSFLEYLDHIGEESEKKVGAEKRRRSEVVRKGKDMMRRSLEKRGRSELQR